MIAVIDDDDAVRDSLLTLLRASGRGCRGFASAEQFLAEAAAEWSCLIVDVNLPGLGGVELVERLRSGGSPVQVIMISGRAEPHARQGARALGADFLDKPIAFDALRRALARPPDRAGPT